MLMSGDVVDFVTLTSHEKLKTFEETEAVWRKTWPVLYNAVKRQKPALCYFIVPEQHRDGRMHVHVLWNAGVTKRWLKDNARKRGLGYQVDVSHVTAWISAVRYVTKYLSKSLGKEMPPRFRRVRVSQNWPDIPKPDNDAAKLQWEFTRSEDVMYVWLAQAQAYGVAVIDMKTGGAFDVYDVDFSLME